MMDRRSWLQLSDRALCNVLLGQRAVCQLDTSSHAVSSIHELDCLAYAYGEIDGLLEIAANMTIEFP